MIQNLREHINFMNGLPKRNSNGGWRNYITCGSIKIDNFTLRNVVARLRWTGFGCTKVNHQLDFIMKCLRCQSIYFQTMNKEQNGYHWSMTLILVAATPKLKLAMDQIFQCLKLPQLSIKSLISSLSILLLRQQQSGGQEIWAGMQTMLWYLHG